MPWNTISTETTNLTLTDFSWLISGRVACGQYKIRVWRETLFCLKGWLRCCLMYTEPSLSRRVTSAWCCKGKVFGLNGFSASDVDFRCQLCFVSFCFPDSDWSVGGMSRPSGKAILQGSPLTLRWANCVAWRPHPWLPLPPLPRQVRERPSPRAGFPSNPRLACDLATQSFPTLSLCYLHSVGWLSCFFLLLS